MSAPKGLDWAPTPEELLRRKVAEPRWDHWDAILMGLVVGILTALWVADATGYFGRFVDWVGGAL